MDEEVTFESLIEERRLAWNGPEKIAAEAQASLAQEALGTDFLEDTVPLPRYRPERLM